LDPLLRMMSKHSPIPDLQIWFFPAQTKMFIRFLQTLQAHLTVFTWEESTRIIQYRLIIKWRFQEQSWRTTIGIFM